MEVSTPPQPLVETTIGLEQVRRRRFGPFPNPCAVFWNGSQTATKKQNPPLKK